ncbi:putative membrane protein [Caulobacter ginsengisoli]|uniref:Membrane protein n=1 Tax=Caulobacter ginsengisoli TaxID=400775 RepID=A0ABU0IVN4_9CAUL|nr:hypothetical protein [Caulobacter ginsengisoli]MDQ0465435.1 putative membrane protein [Caulobacter ginsengisoli]
MKPPEPTPGLPERVDGSASNGPHKVRWQRSIPSRLWLDIPVVLLLGAAYAYQYLSVGDVRRGAIAGVIGALLGVVLVVTGMVLNHLLSKGGERGRAFILEARNRLVRFLAGLALGVLAFLGLHWLLIGTETPSSLGGQLLFAAVLVGGGFGLAFFDLIGSRRRPRP